MNLIFASFNQHKLKEMQYLLAGREILTPADLRISYHCEETGSTFEENALLKARAMLSALTEKPEKNLMQNHVILAEDSGICVNCLGGKPGIHSARFGPELHSDEERVQYLLQCMKGQKDRSAYYVSTMVLLYSQERFIIIRETWQGEIADSALPGTTGFGYDPVFYLPDLQTTVSRISEQEKHRRSHRGKAANTLLRILED